MENALDLSILELARIYRLKEISPVDVVKEVLQRVEEKNQGLNAFISIWSDEALSSAKKYEKAFLNDEKLHVLSGIPFSVKDLFYTKNKLTTCGSKILKDFKPTYTAEVVDKLLDKGAILFGKTNMLEFAYGIVHPDYGKCNNPWDTTKTSGGSSSGSAASIAAGIGHFSLGTDTGGSIRIPASYCGVAGLKPTYGLINSYGVFPLSKTLDHVGPITRSVQDLKIVLKSMINSDSDLSSCLINNKPSISNIKNKNIGVFPDEYIKKLDLNVKQCYKNALDTLKSLGFNIVPICILDLNKIEETLMKVLLPEAAYIHRNWLDRKRDYAPMTFKQIEDGFSITGVDYLTALDQLQQYKNNVNQIFESHKLAAIVTPTVAFPAPEEDPALEDGEVSEMLFTGPFNVTGHPAISVNGGFTEDKLPIGIQFIGPWRGEDELLDVAELFEINCKTRK